MRPEKPKLAHSYRLPRTTRERRRTVASLVDDMTDQSTRMSTVTVVFRPLALFGVVVSMGVGVALGMSAFLVTTHFQAPDERFLLSVLRRVGEQYVDDVSLEQLVDDAVQGVLSGLDGHSILLDEQALLALEQRSSSRFGGVGVELGLIDGYVTVVDALLDTPAERAGIVAGDRLIEVDHQSLRGRTLNDAVAGLRGQPGTDVHLRVQRHAVETPLDFDLTRDNIEAPSVRGRLLEPGYGYVRVARFNDDTADELKEVVDSLRGTDTLDGLMVDLRANPGGLLHAAVAVADAFLDEGMIVYTEGRNADGDLRFEAEAGDLLDGAPLALLVDSDSASAAEVVAGALKDHDRAKVLGLTTYGKGSVQALMYMQRRRAIKLTTARYFTPAGHSIDAVGVEPDIPVAFAEGEGRGDYDERLIARTLTHLKSQRQHGS